jgi:XTP/dITP diphosphohydrolase
MQLLVATTNPGKVHEIRELLRSVSVELVTLADLPPIAAPDETGQTFAENARLKARFYAAATGRLTVAEDSGLEIDWLGGGPGVESARFGGVDSSYPDKFALIYERLRRASGRLRTPGPSAGEAGPGATRSPARFICALAVADGETILFEATGAIEGEIAPEPRGDGGFGYDPIFFYPPFGCTLAEAADKKGSVSHSGNAFRHLRSWLISQVLQSSPPP